MKWDKHGRWVFVLKWRYEWRNQHKTTVSVLLESESVFSGTESALPESESVFSGAESALLGSEPACSRTRNGIQPLYVHSVTAGGRFCGFSLPRNGCGGADIHSVSQNTGRTCWIDTYSVSIAT